MKYFSIKWRDKMSFRKKDLPIKTAEDYHLVKSFLDTYFPKPKESKHAKKIKKESKYRPFNPYKGR